MLNEIQIKSLQTARDKAVEAWRNVAGLVMVGIGRKRRNGDWTGDAAIIAMVKEKLPVQDIKEADVLPKMFDGWLVDVETIDVPVAASNVLRGGDSLYSNRHGSEKGTLGCVAYKQDNTGNDNGQMVILTCSHVIGIHNSGGGKSTLERDNMGIFVRAESQPEVGSCPICARSWKYDGISTYLFPGTDVCDAGLATLKPGVKWLNEIKNIGALKGSRKVETSEVLSGDVKVRKSGAKTNLTYGIIRCIVENGTQSCNAATSGAPSSSERGSGRVLVIQGTNSSYAGSNHFAEGGDSGSMVVDENGVVVGIVTSVSGVFMMGDYAYADSIEIVTEELKIRIPTTTDPSTEQTVAAVSAVFPEGCDGTSSHPASGGGTSGSLHGGMPLHMHDMPSLPSEMHARISKLPLGRTFLSFIEPHLDEIGRLVNRNRACMVAWRRNHGPRLVGYLLKRLEDEHAKYPAGLSQKHWAKLLQAMAPLLRQYGSARLQKALETDIPQFLQQLAQMTRVIEAENMEEKAG